jgi:hypothetical protein
MEFLLYWSMSLRERQGDSMNTPNDAANAEDFEALRKAIALKCYNICLDLAQEKYDEYKGRGNYKPNNPNRANRRMTASEATGG